MSFAIPGLGTVSIRPVDESTPRPPSASDFDDWGERDPEAAAMAIERWLVEVNGEAGGDPVPVGDLSAHAVWYGPSPGSKAMNIGISLAPEYRGRGIGATAQRLLAELLHDRGIVRVEASTDVGNIAEQRALDRAGFVYEGTLRLAQARRDGLHDLQVWSHVRPPGETPG